jgi:hypothetical protein
MYKVTGEPFDPTDGKYRVERWWTATAFQCLQQQVTGRSDAKLWLEDTSILMVPVSSKPTDFQLVTVYDKEGVCVQYMKVVSGTVGAHLGPVVHGS